MRVGEANNLKIRDLETFEDDLGRRNYRFKVKGKTGERDVILRASAAKSVDRLLTRRSGAGADDWLFVMRDGSRVIALIDQFDKVLVLNILDGTVIGRNMQRHRHQEFIRFLNTDAKNRVWILPV